jgi:ATP-dependent Clp protease ATP-binding subunit ClpB
MDIASYSSDSRSAIKVAKEIAAEFRHPEIEIEHLMVAVVRQEGTEVESVLNQVGKPPTIVSSIVESFLKDQPSRSSARENLSISPEVQEVLNRALDEKEKLFDALVEPEHILMSILDIRSPLSGYVRDKIGFTKEDIYRALADSRSVEEITSTSAAGDTEETTLESRKPVPGSLRYCLDMTNQASAGEFDPMIGRDSELRQVIQVLLRRRKNSPVLVGGAGVGKSAIVEGFAQSLVAGDVPEQLRGVRVMELDMGSLVAGAKYKGEFEERFKSLISEVIKSAGSIILFIDELHTITSAGAGSGGMDAANLLKPALARGQLRLIGATTEEEYTKYIEKDKALLRRFEKIGVEEPTIDESTSIVTGVVEKYEKHHGINYSEGACSAAVKLAKRYLSEKNLPDVALDLIDEAASEFSVKREMSRRLIPELEQKIAQLETTLNSIDGKRAGDKPQLSDDMASAYSEIDKSLESLKLFWGHRLETGGHA